MSQLTEEDKRVLKEELLKLGFKTLRLSKQKAPVDTGRLRASITLADNSGVIENTGPEASPSDGLNSRASNFSVVVGTNVDYAEFIEFGTSSQDAQPFLRPAADQALSETNLDT